ncbi:DUF6207 family protein [Streptomyces sp. MMS24-I29]|uniref:DUF6207 family protein n=1 Tax=Streptomyces sp. MMS24-I29 TaxID=3351480 RepID=UPI003C7BC312
MQIDEQHIAEPGLVVLDITAADKDTLRTVMDVLQQWWATSGIAPVRRFRAPAAFPARVGIDRAGRRARTRAGRAARSGGAVLGDVYAGRVRAVPRRRAPGFGHHAPQAQLPGNQARHGPPPGLPATTPTSRSWRSTSAAVWSARVSVVWPSRSEIRS